MLFRSKMIVNKKGNIGNGKMDSANQIKSIKSRVTQKGEGGKIFRKEVGKQAAKEMGKKIAKKVVKKAVVATANFLISTAPFGHQSS